MSNIKFIKITFRSSLLWMFLPLIVMLVYSFGIALLPEHSAKLLTPTVGWSGNEVNSSRVLLSSFPVQYRQVRLSAVESTGGQVFRTWTPDKGIITLDLTSPSFKPTPFMLVVITGTNRTEKGLVQAYIECAQTGRHLEIFRGSVNVNVAEAIVVAPDAWCIGDARLKLTSSERNVNVGVGSVFKISYLSYLKSSYFGRVPYFLVSLCIFSLVILAGSSLAIRLSWHVDSLPIGLASLGFVSLGIFYLSSMVLAIGVPESLHWIAIMAVAIVIAIALVWSGREARIQAIRTLIPYARVWFVASFVYFTILSLTSNGLGHWEPNYRFWPAVWSSDNELPWIFAESVRRGWDLKSLFGGGWIPTDRPPLMAGAHLLLSDIFGWLQSANDGTYMRGHAYNAAAVILNALWVPAAFWLLKTLSKDIDNKGYTAILVLVGCLPFVLFNTVYGWPKAFGAAFALVAFGLAVQFHEYKSDLSAKSSILLFFVVGAFSMLAHASTALFLAPLGLLFLWWTLHRNKWHIVFGFLTALVLLASWSIYKLLVLSSADPVIKYALTGDYGFGHPDWTLFQMLSNRYVGMSFWQWLEIKRIMLLQAFLPIDHSITQIGLNLDFGARSIDKLRAWDFMLLSKGNLAVPLLVIVAILHGTSLYLKDKKVKITPFATLIGVSLVAWLLVVVGFLAPAIIHHLPQAALFGLALGGSAVVYGRYQVIFLITLLAVVTYTGLVWILLPLRSVLTIDGGAAFVLVALGSYALLPILTSSRNRLNLKLDMNTYLSLRAWFAASAASITIQRIGNLIVWSFSLRALTMSAFLFTTYITLRYIQQPLADVHAFRQTQTALTAYWMLKDGWIFSYQTPVTGFPWSIPFEFPIYQSIVAAIVYWTGFDLSSVGRFVSYLFLVGCAWPMSTLSRRLNLPRSVSWVFCALLWTSPLNVYWGRTFMIETTALFFSLTSIPYAIDLIRRDGGWRSAVLFIVFATAAVLQKATTGGPVILFLVSSALFFYIRKDGFNFLTCRRFLHSIIIFGIPLIIGLFWAHFADVVKMTNPFGTQLTSEALSAWNFGSLKQRLDFETYRLVIWERSFKWNAGGVLGIVILIMPWFGGARHRRLALLSLWSLILFLLPILIFTNLHIVHEYYQVSCDAFLLFALAIVIGGWLKEVSGTIAIVPIVTLIIMLSNVASFYSSYGVVVARSIDELDPRSVQSYKVGHYLREHTRPDSGLVIFNQSYSSEIAYQAQRKSMTAPPWFKEYKQLWDNPQAYLGDLELGAIVICPVTDGFPNMTDLQQRLVVDSSWIHKTVYGCELLLKSSN